MAEPDEAEQAAQRLETALERIAAAGSSGPQKALPAAVDPRIASKLDNLIRALRTALDT